MGEAAQIPTSFGHELRACRRCRLVKTYDQFREVGCENCPFFNMDQDHDHVVECTTPNFSGIISVMDPGRSWAARWLRIGRFVPGCYTLSVSEELPEEYKIDPLKIFELSLIELGYASKENLVNLSSEYISYVTQGSGTKVDDKVLWTLMKVFVHRRRFTRRVARVLKLCDRQAICEDNRVHYVPPKR